MPLGTLVGVLDGDASATQIKIKSITDNRYQTAESLAEIGTQSTALPCRNVKVSLYQTSRGSTLYPLGIFMTALGENGKTFLDIYGGGYAASTATAGGFAKPVLRIGNLAGLPAVGGQNPTGYGIYTSNGYFTGTIVSTSGTIGNWSITSSSIQTGAFDTAGKMYFGNNGISLGTTFKVTSAGELTATSGTIGGITIGGTYLTTAAARKTYDAATAGLTITSSGIGAGNGTTNTFKVVAATGALTASNATLTGGSIAGWSFDTVSLYKTNATPGYSAATMVISTGTKSKKNIGEGGTDEKTWMLSAGTGFGVTTAGKLYATGAVIKGKITATSGSFDSVSATNFTLTSGSIAGAVKIGGSSGDSASTVLNNITNAANTAKSYITDIDSNNGIIIKAILGTDDTNTQTGNYIKLNATDGLLVYKGGSRVASFGSTVELGSGSFTAKISSSSFSIHRFGSMYCYADISYDSVNKGPSYLFGELVTLEPGNPGLYSMSSGLNSNGEGYCSRASGYYIKANTDYQTAIGKYNNNNSSNAFEIGWGTADNARKNIFAVGTDGTVKINETNMNDFVVEQGNSYRKWNSGLAECWVHTAQNVALNNAYGSLYQGAWTWKFPITFNANPAVTCSHFKWGTGGSWGTIGGVSTTAATLRGFDTYSRAAGTCDIAAYAIGRWK